MGQIIALWLISFTEFNFTFSLGGILPGSFHYLHIAKPAIPTPLEVHRTQSDLVCVISNSHYTFPLNTLHTGLGFLCLALSVMFDSFIRVIVAPMDTSMVPYDSFPSICTPLFWSPPTQKRTYLCSKWVIVGEIVFDFWVYITEHISSFLLSPPNFFTTALLWAYLGNHCGETYMLG